MLKRKFYDVLLEWKKSHNREGLLVKGARQIGKTYIIDRFARDNYASYVYINFIDKPDLRRIFSGSISADDVFLKLSSAFVDFKLIPGNTVLFLDEIQKCPRARTAIKPLALDGRIDVICSGSLLGLTFLNDELRQERQEESVPVGYERQLTMHSLDFEEYLWAVGYRSDVIDALRDSFRTLTPLEAVVNDRMEGFFRDYLAVGGMPEVVNRFLEENSYSAAYREQEKIISSNLDDIARYAPTVEKPKIRACYLSLPRHLARENTKFKYRDVEPGGSCRKFGNSIDWLSEASIAYRCFNLEQPSLPLNVYSKLDCFKLYASDVGILTGLMGFDVKKAIVEDTLEKFAKGGLYENAIMCQLVRNGHHPAYYMPRANVAEVDFFIETADGVVPIELKAKRGGSTSFDEQLKRTEISRGYKFTAGNVGCVGKKITLPHYMSMFV